MSYKPLLIILTIAFCLSFMLTSATAMPFGTTITYQGRLTDDSLPSNGLFDFEFKLFDDLAAGSQQGITLTADDVPVSEGLFTVPLDFGAGIFAGDDRFLEIGVRPGVSVGAYTMLSPRQALTATPYALYASSAGGAPWSGLTGVPAGFADGIDDDTDTNTTYTAGTGLALSGTEFSVVSMPRPGFKTTAVAGSGGASAGPHTSVAIGADGLGLISYTADFGKALFVAHCENIECSSATKTGLDFGGTDQFQYTSIAIGADGFGLISYYDATGRVKVAHCSNVRCTSATIATITGGPPGIGQFTSIAIGVDGLGIVSYYNAAAGTFHVAHCADTACSSANSISTLDGGPAGQFTSIAIGTDGLALVSYFHGAGQLRVAHCSNTVCSAATIAVLDAGNVGRYTSITIGADGLGLISYHDAAFARLKVAHCSNVICSAATISPIDSGSVGEFSSITMGADALGVVSYYDAAGRLKVAHCSNITCTSGTAYVVDSSANVGRHTSITLGIDDRPLISHYDISNDDLKVAHCSNPYCLPYVRPR